MDDEAISPEPDALKLRAVDADDLAVLAAFLQDAIANVSEMAYLPEEKRFVLVVCRFRWELAMSANPEEVFERVSCAITFEGVSEPKYRGFTLKERGRTIPLLTIIHEDGAVILTFGGNAAIRLAVSSLDMRMEDFGACWPTSLRPEHGSNDLD
jgi:hypothetical protein